MRNSKMWNSQNIIFLKKAEFLIGNTKKKGSDFSGGQAKMLLLFAHCINKPKILLLDEPLAGLDEVFQEEVISLIQSSLEFGTICLISDHTGIIHKHLNLSNILEFSQIRERLDPCHPNYIVKKNKVRG